MVAIDTTSGIPVRVGGAALVSGPSVTIRPEGRVPGSFAGAPGVTWSSVLAPYVRRTPGADPEAAPATAPAPEDVATDTPAGVTASYRPWLVARPAPASEVPLAPMWGVAGYFAGALFGPPYELPDATMEWQVRADTLRGFRQSDRAARMALRVHPTGPQLQTAGSFVSQLYGLTPSPDCLGIGVDFAS